MNPIFLLIALSIQPAAQAEKGPEFMLISPSFDNGAILPLKQVHQLDECGGRNESPALDWTDGPTGTKSYAVTAYDPDAPSGSGWWHWTLFNIPSEVTSLREAMTKLPKGSVQGRNDWGVSAYGGACPPKGSKPHRYIFTVYALKVASIPLDSEASGAMVGYYIHQNMLAKASVTGLFSR